MHKSWYEIWFTPGTSCNGENAEKDLELLHFDIQTAFLYKNLEDFFMEILEGINIEENSREDSIRNSVVWKLNKVLL